MSTKVLITASMIALMSNTLMAFDGDTFSVTFSNSAMGWSGSNGNDGFGGGTTIEQNGGNPGNYMRTVFNDFGVTYRNSTNEWYLGDYTTSDSINISVDVRVENLNFFGTDVPRPWLVELRDYDSAQGGYPYTSVWYLFDDISEANNAEWTNYTTGSFDPNAIELPAGWGGTGAEDPETFEPTLPDGVSFADVLSGVDEIVFTTLQPGLFFGFTDHTIGIDNIILFRPGIRCLADINGDGTLNFFDISAYIDYIQNDDLLGDLTGDGELNFFDISLFINLYIAGC
jgi:hypothetical protein